MLAARVQHVLLLLESCRKCVTQDLGLDFQPGPRVEASRARLAGDRYMDVYQKRLAAAISPARTRSAAMRCASRASVSSGVSAHTNSLSQHCCIRATAMRTGAHRQTRWRHVQQQRCPNGSQKILDARRADYAAPQTFPETGCRRGSPDPCRGTYRARRRASRAGRRVRECAAAAASVTNDEGLPLRAGRGRRYHGRALPSVLGD